MKPTVIMTRQRIASLVKHIMYIQDALESINDIERGHRPRSEGLSQYFAG